MNYLSKEGANELVYKLTDYWDALGYTTHKFWIEYQSFRKNGGNSEGLWVVRSNLINCLPPKQQDITYEKTNTQSTVRKLVNGSV